MCVHKRLFSDDVEAEGGACIGSVRWCFAFEWQWRVVESFGERGQARRFRQPLSKLPVELVGLCRFEAGEQHQVVGHHGGPDVGLEVIEPAPSAAGQTVGALEAGDPGLDRPRSAAGGRRP